MLNHTIGTSIKKRRKELGITQPHLAELAQISTNTLYNIERGQGNPTLAIMEKLAKVLGMELKLEVSLPLRNTNIISGKDNAKI